MFPNMSTTATIRYVTCISVVVISAGFAAPAVDQYTQGVDWLSRYGYLPPPDPHTGMLQTMDEIKKALKEMQSFAGLKVTGILDADTVRLMSTPRCSLPDIMRPEDKLRKRRRKRYVLSGSRWHKTDITWSLNSYPSPSSKLDPQLVKQLLSQAFRVWSDVIPLNFHSKRDLKEEGDIRVYFASGFHQDGYPFDGKGGTLAHAFFPSNHEMAGDTHFDDDEIWSFGGDSDSTDLFTVAVHEFGHALGLSHSSTELSIMMPYYQGAITDINSYKLPKDDMLGIQALYGKRNDRVAPDPRIPPIPDRPHQPNPPHQNQHNAQTPPFLIVVRGFDAVVNIRGEVFFFKGPYFWRVRPTGSLMSFTPALIKNFWIGLPPETNKIDAVYERTSDGNIVFFIGNQYWVFKETISLPGYPHPLSEWRMQTSDGRNVQRVEAAFVWARNGKTYLFSNGEFWGFDDERQIGRNMDGQYPRETTLWKGVPSGPDGVISWGDGDLYFFKGNSYWILKNGEMNHEAIISKSVAVDWMKCPKPQMRDESNCPLGTAFMSQISFWVIWISIVNICVFIE